MSITLDLPPELAERLTQVAARMGLSLRQYLVQVLERHAPPEDRRAELVGLIQSWIDSPDVEEQRETGEFLVKALDEDRPSDRKLFPPELKGVTW